MVKYGPRIARSPVTITSYRPLEPEAFLTKLRGPVSQPIVIPAPSFSPRCGQFLREQASVHVIYNVREPPVRICSVVPINRTITTNLALTGGTPYAKNKKR